MLTSDEVRLMAFDAYQSSPVPAVMLMTKEALEHLAAAAYAAGQAAEREACARIVESEKIGFAYDDEQLTRIATTIRTRNMENGKI